MNNTQKPIKPSRIWRRHLLAVRMKIPVIKCEKRSAVLKARGARPPDG